MSVEENQREKYLGTNNRRPGPSLEESKAQKEVLHARKQRDQAKKDTNIFNPLSPRLGLDKVEWRNMKTIENVKDGVFAIGMSYGGFILKGAPDTVSAFFCNSLY